MRILDLFCGAGGASMGYARAGWEVVGVDINPQPHYPFEFHQADAMTWPIDFVDAVHASPPCQRYTRGAKRWQTQDLHPDLIPETRDRVEAAGIPYVIENVPGAPLRTDVLLCGSMFGLRLVRHRIFELSGFTVDQPAHETHAADYVTVTGHPGGSSTRDGNVGFGSTADWKEAMDIDWMPGSGMAQAIPPAYTEYLGKQMYELCA